MAQEGDAMQETEREATARQERDPVYRHSKKSKQKNRENRIFPIEQGVGPMTHPLCSMNQHAIFCISRKLRAEHRVDGLPESIY
jgi:hypothetical protein